MSKVVLYIASSLDGFIAREDDSLDWLEGFPNPDHLDYGYAEFLKRVGTIIMGRKTYQVILGFGVDWPYQGIRSYVVSSDKKFNITTPDTFLISIEEIPDRLKTIKETFEKDIWLIGGGQLVTKFLNLGLIDRMEITIIPTILGAGIPLFPLKPKETTWKNIDTKTYSTGVVTLIYEQ